MPPRSGHAASRGDPLRLLHDVVAALTTGGDTAGAVRSLLAAIGQAFGWEFGALWEVDAASGELRVASVWHAPDLDASELARATSAAAFAPGDGLVGRAAQQAKPIWVEDLAQYDVFRRADAAAAAGLRSALLFPVVARATAPTTGAGDAAGRGRADGVIELFSKSRRAPDAALQETLATVGRQIGMFLARSRAEQALADAERRFRADLEEKVAERTAALQREIAERRAVEDELRASRAKLQRLYESPLIGIVVGTTDGAILEANDTFLRIAGYTREEQARLRWDELTPDEWRAQDARTTEQMVARGYTDVIEKEIARRDGSRVPILAAAALLHGSTTQFIAFVMDISERKRVQRELAALNATLEQRVLDRTRSLQESEARLAESERLMRALAARIESVRESERAALAREIHDVLGQELTGLKLDAAWVMRRVAETAGDDAAAARARLQSMLQQIDAATATVRRIATTLRPGVLDDLGLIAALEWQAREFAGRAGFAIELDLPAEEVPVDRDRATAMFRAFQELLTNVARHAEARRVRAAVSRVDGALVMEVHDDGRGVDDDDVARSTSLGLLGIRERLAPFGGELFIARAPQGGTRARVRMPLPPSAAR